MIDLDKIEHVLRWAASDRLVPPMIPQKQAELALAEFLLLRSLFVAPIDTTVDL